MANFMKMVEIQSVLFLYLAVGYACRKGGMFPDEFRDKLTDFLVLITLPCMIFKSFLIEFSMQMLIQGGLALIISATVAFAALFLGKVLYNRFDPREKSIMQYGTLVTNAGFAGMPIVVSAYGNEGLFLASLYVIPNRILMWSAGLAFFTKGATIKEQIKKLITNPSIIVVFFGMIWMVWQLPLPGFLDTAITNLGNCTSPMAMALVGAILADIPLKGVWDTKILLLIFVRQILLPGLCLVVLKQLNIDPLTIGVSVTLAGMPIGSTTAILAQKYGADGKYASKCVFLSTLSSLITVPVLTFFL